MAHVGALFAKAAQTLGVAVLTPEYEIVLALVDYPSLTAEQLQDQSSLSRAGFFNTIERLKSWKVIVSATDAGDRRRRIYKLSEEIRESILQRFIQYRSDYLESEGAHGGRRFVTKDLTARRRKGLEYFTCEFKIMFYLFLWPNLQNHVLKGLVDVSESKFHTSLKSLLERNLIVATSEASDRRVRLYSPSCFARLALQKLHGDIFQWLDGFDPVMNPRALMQAAWVTSEHAMPSPKKRLSPN